MNKKQLMNQLNSQKGLTGADIVLALLIIVTTVGVIAMVYVNLVIRSREVDRKTGATRISTNIVENMSQKYYDEITSHLNILSTQGIATKQESTYTIAGGTNVKVFETKVPKGYQVVINCKNSYGEQSSGYDLVKKATVTVHYTVDGQNKKVSLDKVFEREIIRECNSPNFSEEYIRPILGANVEYELYTPDSKNQIAKKIICPIRYNKQTKHYEIITNTTGLWYSYSNKQWARILVLDPGQVETTITNEMAQGSNSYVWIPRFGVESGKDLIGGTFFKYKATDYAILSNYDKNAIPNLICYTIDSDKDWSENRGIEEKDLLGRWYNYSQVQNVNSEAYTLNHSQYGPMMEY